MWDKVNDFWKKIAIFRPNILRQFNSFKPNKNFYEKLIQYRDKEILDENGKVKKVKGSFASVVMDKEIGGIVNRVRLAYKGKGTLKLTQDMIDKLNAIGFDWGKDKEEIEGQWFTLFYEKLIEYKENNGSFIGVTNNKEIGKTVSRVRQVYKGKGRTKLTQEMIDKLNAIGFPWEARAKKVQEDVLSV